ncbi:NAD(P)/FAD-dependent oxidoreductase [Pelagovum sp. HNIBRBA483]|uniref:NAD(P)/FAD-dependent oxidoreductase n=1 Tax=Pelagovum sp. HNIBRBA483 TaxID=3233341 RepID=UPI0034A100B9
MSYDVVIIGGGMIGASCAWWLARDPDFKGKVLVIERDPTYEFASTSHTNSSIRQQFGSEINIRISQFGAEFIHNFKEFMGVPDAPEITLQSFGYLYLADTPAFAETLRASAALQQSLGAGTRILTPDEIAAQWPFYNLDGIILGSHNPVNEGYFDGGTIFDWFRRQSRALGVEWRTGEVTGISREGGRVTGVTLADGGSIACGTLVNASGPRAALTARMAGLDLPVEPRRRFTFVFDAAEPLPADLPLTIDPSGVHMRSDGRYYLCGCPPDLDPAVDFTDFTMDHEIWEDKVWPAIATRVPAFERVKVINHWVGHYAFNTLDQNAIVGPHPDLPNFLFCNGFSGHGLQQSPAMGRGIAELVTHGGYRSLDLSPLGVERIIENRPLLERAVI